MSTYPGYRAAWFDSSGVLVGSRDFHTQAERRSFVDGFEAAACLASALGGRVYLLPDGAEAVPIRERRILEERGWL